MLAMLDARQEQRLVWLMFARLVLAVVSFGIAIGLDALGRSLSLEAKEGLYWTVGFAFLATVLTGAYFPRIRRPQRFAAVQLGTDVALVTALVYFSGGHESIFTFFYAVVTLYAAVLFGRPAALGAATLSSLSYGSILLAANRGWVINYGAHDGPLPLPILGAMWGVYVGALFLVGALASVLSDELHRTGAALSQSTTDLQRLRDLHQRTVESIMSGLLTTDSAGRLTSFNPEAEQITGSSAADVLGCPVDEVIPGARALLGDAEVGVLAPSSLRARLPYRNRSGDHLFLGLAGSILKQEDGSASGFVLIFQDVTRVVAMEEELRRSERLAAVGEMGAKIAHEIRNPLAAISGSIQILRQGITSGRSEYERTRLMDIVVREADRLNQLITDFLRFARPRPMRVEPVEAGALLEDLASVFEAARPDDVELVLDPIEPARMAGDPDQLKQIFWNLCINAVQAMPEGGTLRLSVRSIEDESPQGESGADRNGADGAVSAGDGGCVEVVVRDTGIGIPGEVQGRMFEPFFTTKREGSGLGLATVHRIVESHGGSVQLESEMGLGSTFRIRLPRWEGSG